MKKALILFFILIALTSCTSGRSTIEENRFKVIAQDYNFFVMYDTETKVQYAVTNGCGTRGMMTLLVDSEGKPLLYEEAKR